MDRGIVARIEDWEQEPFSGGYAGLADLADAEFSGVVESGETRLFVLNGRIVGGSGGTVEDFENATGTAYRTPHPGLPLLFAMQERGGEAKARYFTDDTPLGDVHETLSSGSFTGYVELSENVHSGDYYVVYYGGRALKVAFVGGTGRRITDDEAFERAKDEVGIYEVYDVDLDVRDVPEPDESTTATDEETGHIPHDGEARSSTDPATTGTVPETTDGEDDSTNGEDRLRTGQSPPSERDATDVSPDEPASDGATQASGTDLDAGSDTDPPREDEATTKETREGTTATDPTDRTDPGGKDQPTQTTARDRPEPGDDERQGGGTPGQRGSETRSDGETTTERPAEAVTGAGGSRSGNAEDPLTEEEAWRETRSVPALDPEESAPVTSDPDANTGDEDRAPSPQSEDPGMPEAGTPDRSRDPDSSEDSDAPRTEPSTDRSEEPDRTAELRNRLDDVTHERDELRDELERLREERDRLERRVRELEAETDAGDGERSMEPADALEQTDLLVRYGSKSDPTLSALQDDEGVTPQEIEANLDFETHTRFDPDGVTVDGEPYETFVSETLEYRFATWVLGTLPFEIRDTGSRTALGDLYDAIPDVDRVEFDAAVTMRDDEGEERRETFDVVFRDQMGQPVAVADLNDHLDPATGDMMVDLVESANAVVEEQDSLSSAFLVTASFFDRDAHETAKEATESGFLDRDSRESFVKISRNRGYHLCLVEAHGEAFRLSVPDL